MSFGDKRLDRAFDQWQTRSPPEYDDEEIDLNAYQRAKKKAFDDGYKKGRHDERVALFEKLIKQEQNRLKKKRGKK